MVQIMIILTVLFLVLIHSENLLPPPIIFGVLGSCKTTTMKIMEKLWPTLNMIYSVNNVFA
jgi:hypothetical protein